MFHSEEEIAKLYPDAYASVLNENKMQYPNAKFVSSASGNYGCDVDNTIDVMFIYDVGTPDMYLWVWAVGDLGAHVDGDRFFIDEYYETSQEDAIRYLGDIQ